MICDHCRRDRKVYPYDGRWLCYGCMMAAMHLANEERYHNARARRIESGRLGKDKGSQHGA